MENGDERHIIELLSKPETQRKAFEMVVRRYSEQLYWQVRRIVLTHEDADDVMQNTFIKAWNHLDTFRNASKLSTWEARRPLQAGHSCSNTKIFPTQILLYHRQHLSQTTYALSYDRSL